MKIYSSTKPAISLNYVVTDRVFSLFYSSVDLFSRIDFDTADLSIINIIAYNSSINQNVKQYATMFLPVIKNSCVQD